MKAGIENPFVGLRPFDTDESLLFFGREQQIIDLLQMLHQHHFVAVLGSSGSGKSSLIRAGLIPRLRAGYLINKTDKWLIASMKPGERPLSNLVECILHQLNLSQNFSSLIKEIEEKGSSALINTIKHLWEDRNTSVFILVDQFEELFRFTSISLNKDEANEFVNILLELASDHTIPVYVVITMRSDFIGDCDQFYGLPEAVNRSSYLVPKPNRMQLRASIEGPVKLFGVKMHPALVSRVLNELQATKDELPLLQHTMMRVWDHEKKVDRDNELNLDDYEKVGGIEKALNNHAEEAIRGMTNDQVDLTREMFQALTSIDENGRKIRKPAKLSQLITVIGTDKEKLMEVIKLINKDGRSFLLTSPIPGEDDLLIDISHESLIRNWERLRKWVEEESEAAFTYSHFVTAAHRYKQKKKDLLEGSELQIGLLWLKNFKPKKEWAEQYNRNFEETINYIRESEKEWLKEQAVKQKLRRKRIVSRIIIIALAVGFLSMMYMFISIRTANKRTEKTKYVYQLISLAKSQEVINPTIALRIAESALNKLKNDEAIFKITYQIFEYNNFYKTIIKSDNPNSPSFISPTGELFLTCSKNNMLQLWNNKGKLVDSFAQNSRLVSAGFSPDENMVIAGTANGQIALWTLRGGPKKVVNGHQAAVTGVGFLSGNNQIISASEDSTLKLWTDLMDEIREFRNKEKIKGFSIKSDGSKLVGFGDRNVLVFDIPNFDTLDYYFGTHDKPTAVQYCRSVSINRFLVAFITRDSNNVETGVVKLYPDDDLRHHIKRNNIVLAEQLKAHNLQFDEQDPASSKFFLNSPVTNIYFSGDGFFNWRVVSATQDGTIHEHFAKAFSLDFREGLNFHGIQSPVTSINVVASPDLTAGHSLYLTGYSDGTVKKWVYTYKSLTPEVEKQEQERTPEKRRKLRDFLKSELDSLTEEQVNKLGLN